jgi:hypothetical protein
VKTRLWLYQEIVGKRIILAPGNIVVDKWQSVTGLLEIIFPFLGIIVYLYDES